jgi:hypothetical protein
MAETRDQNQPIIPLLDPDHDPGNTPAPSADTSTSMSGDKMKAVHYEGPFKVSVKEIGLPTIQHPDDVIVKVTTAAICGSDLHMYVLSMFRLLCRYCVCVDSGVKRTGTKGERLQRRGWFSDTRIWGLWWRLAPASRW